MKINLTCVLSKVKQNAELIYINLLLKTSLNVQSLIPGWTNPSAMHPHMILLFQNKLNHYKKSPPPPPAPFYCPSNLFHQYPHDLFLLSNFSAECH